MIQGIDAPRLGNVFSSATEERAVVRLAQDIRTQDQALLAARNVEPAGQGNPTPLQTGLPRAGETAQAATLQAPRANSAANSFTPRNVALVEPFNQPARSAQPQAIPPTPGRAEPAPPPADAAFRPAPNGRQPPPNPVAQFGLAALGSPLVSAPNTAIVTAQGTPRPEAGGEEANGEAAPEAAAPFQPRPGNTEGIGTAFRTPPGTLAGEARLGPPRPRIAGDQVPPPRQERQAPVNNGAALLPQERAVLSPVNRPQPPGVNEGAGARALPADLGALPNTAPPALARPDFTTEEGATENSQGAIPPGATRPADTNPATIIPDNNTRQPVAARPNTPPTAVNEARESAAQLGAERRLENPEENTRLEETSRRQAIRPPTRPPALAVRFFQSAAALGPRGGGTNNTVDFAA